MVRGETKGTSVDPGRTGWTCRRGSEKKKESSATCVRKRGTPTKNSDLCPKRRQPDRLGVGDERDYDGWARLVGGGMGLTGTVSGEGRDLCRTRVVSIDEHRGRRTMGKRRDPETCRRRRRSLRE